MKAKRKRKENIETSVPREISRFWGSKSKGPCGISRSDTEELKRSSLDEIGIPNWNGYHFEKGP